MYETPKKFKITVPATSANIGPGFDVLGLALSLYLTLEVEVLKVDDEPAPQEQRKVTLEYLGEGAEEAPLDPYKNLITRVALYVLRCHGKPYFPRRVHVVVHNEIPFGRGLGSSGAAVIAGVLLGDALGELGLSVERKLDFALMVERHPDNVTAALLGGFAGSYLRELSREDTTATQIPLAEVLPEYPPDASEEWGKEPPVPPSGIGHYIKFGWAPEIKVVAVIPSFELSTAKARNALQKEYALKDCVFNLQRLSVLTHALSRSPPDADLIFTAMQDRIHQPYRKKLVPALSDILEQMTPKTDAGLLGICLSGAGPTVVALATERFDEIGTRVEQIWASAGVKSLRRTLEVDQVGARCEAL